MISLKYFIVTHFHVPPLFHFCKFLSDKYSVFVTISLKNAYMNTFWEMTKFW